MGFVNEAIRDQDRNLVDFQYLYNPGGRATFEPTEWCIDRERNAIFIRVPRIGRHGPGMPDQYALILSSLGFGVIVWANLFNDVELTVPKRVTWRLSGLTHGERVTLSSDDILAMLREALDAFTRRWLKTPWVDHEQIDIEYRF